MAKRSYTRCTTIAVKAIVKCYFENCGSHGKPIPANINEGKTYPVFAKCVEIEWYTVEKDESEIAQQARAIDKSYLVTRQNKETHPSWSAFNQSLSKRSAESAAITTVDYMPIIQAPAHELDTRNSTVRYCVYISSQL
jgi:hypothetical protein